MEADVQPCSTSATMRSARTAPAAGTVGFGQADQQRHAVPADVGCARQSVERLVSSSTSRSCRFSPRSIPGTAAPTIGSPVVVQRRAGP